MLPSIFIIKRFYIKIYYGKYSKVNLTRYESDALASANTIFTIHSEFYSRRIF